MRIILHNFAKTHVAHKTENLQNCFVFKFREVTT